MTPSSTPSPIPAPTPSPSGFPRTTRAAAAADLLDALQYLVLEYSAMTEDERDAHLHHDADRITGQVARRLDVARQRLRHPVGTGFLPGAHSVRPLR